MKSGPLTVIQGVPADFSLRFFFAKKRDIGRQQGKMASAKKVLTPILKFLNCSGMLVGNLSHAEADRCGTQGTGANCLEMLRMPSSIFTRL